MIIKFKKLNLYIFVEKSILIQQKCVVLHQKFLQIYNIFPKQKENDKRN